MNKFDHREYYRGIVPVLTTIGVSQFIYFYLFEFSKKVLLFLKSLKTRRKDATATTAFDSFVASLLAGVFNMLLTEPLWKANMRCMLALKDRPAEVLEPVEMKKQTSKTNTSVASSPISPLVDSNIPVVSAASSKESIPSGRAAPVQQRGGALLKQQPLEGEERPRPLSSSTTHNVFLVCYRMGQEEGFKSMWSGFVTSLWLVSNPMIQYALYDVLKKFERGGPAENISAVKAFLLGSLTKTIATVVTYPLQVTQTRMRVSDTRDVAGKDAKGFADCMREIKELEGVGAFFKGLQPKLVQTVSQAAFMFAFYEALLKRARTIFLRRQNN
eukprot:g5804.t1